MAEKSSAREWLKALMLATSSLSIGLGAFAIYAWHADSFYLTPFQLGRLIMSYNAAVAFILYGVAAVALIFGHQKFARYMGLFIFIFGLALIARTWPGIKARLPIGEAVGFCLIGIALFLMTFYHGLKRPFLLIASISSLLIARSAMVFFHYAIGTPLPLDWLHSMALSSSLAFFFIGVGILAFLYREKPLETRSSIHWLPVTCVIGSLAITLSFWQAEVKKDQDRISQLLYVNAFSLRHQLKLNMETRLHTLAHLARTWSVRGRPTKQQWIFESQSMLNEYTGFQSLGWIDSTFHPQWLVTNDGSNALSQNNRSLLNLLNSLKAGRTVTKDVILAGPNNFIGSDPQFVALAPIVEAGVFQGFILGGINERTFFSSILEQSLNKDVAVRVAIGDKKTFEMNLPKDANFLAWTDPVPIEVEKEMWYLRVSPTDEFLNKNRSYVAGATLAIGVLVSLVLGLILYLLQTVRRRAGALQMANMELKREIGLRLSTEKSLANQGERLKSIMDAMGDGVIVADVDGRIVGVNPAAKKIMQADVTGQKPDEWKLPVKIYKPDATAVYAIADYPIVRGTRGEPVDNVEMLLRSPDTEEDVWVTSTTRPIRGESGIIQGAVSVFRDITAAKKAELILEQSQAEIIKLASIVESSDDAIISITLDGNIGSWNLAAEKIFGYSEDEVRGRALSLLFPSERETELRDVIEKIKNGGHVSSFETVHVRKDGRPVHVSVTKSPIRDQAGTLVGISIAARDISRRVATEKALRESQDLFHSFMNNSPTVAFMKDAQGRYVYVNRVFEQLHGQTLGEIQGKTDFDWLPDHIAAQLKKNDEAALASDTLFETIERVPVADGSIRDWLVFRFVIKTGPEEKRTVAGVAVDISERRRAEEAIRRANAELELRVLERTKELDGAIQTMQAEIMARKKIEKELAKRAEELAASNQELEHFAMVASHDLQEPLRKISSYGELLAQRYKGQLDEKADKFIGYMTDGAARMQNLIRGLLTYARVGRGTEPQFQMVDLKEIVEQALRDLENSIQKSDAEIICDALPIVYANRSQMGQLFQNLIANAIKFRGHQRPRIRISAVQKSNEWEISIKDNGIGIDSQHVNRVFQIFQRLHSQKEFPGTGIGLAICKKIIELHDGHIWIQSKKGEGATVFFTLPLKLEAATPSGAVS